MTFAPDFDHETYNVDYNLRFIKKHSESTVFNQDIASCDCLSGLVISRVQDHVLAEENLTDFP